MKIHEVKVFPSKTPLPRSAQLAWKMAEVAADPPLRQFPLPSNMVDAGAAARGA